MSKSILGKVDRETEKYSCLQQFLEADYRESIGCKYKLSRNILGLAPNLKLAHNLIPSVQKKIVFPFRNFLIKELVRCRTINEACVFLDKPVNFISRKRHTTRQVIQY
jgi:hypothetical protein